MKLKTKLLLDVIMFVIILICMEYNFTGAVLHEVIGIALILAFIFHALILNGKYYISMTKQFFAKKINNTKLITSYITNVILLLCSVLMLISSIAISKKLFAFLNQNVNHYDLWRNIHIISSVSILICIFVHVLMHAKMLMNLVKQRLKSENTIRAVRLSSKVIAVLLAILIIKLSIDNVSIISKTSFSKKTGENEYYHYEKEETTTSEDTKITLPDGTEITEAPDSNIPTLKTYLSSLFCDGCGKHCSLANPRCGVGRQNAQRATQEYNETYGEA